MELEGNIQGSKKGREGERGDLGVQRSERLRECRHEKLGRRESIKIQQRPK